MMGDCGRRKGVGAQVGGLGFVIWDLGLALVWAGSQGMIWFGILCDGMGCSMTGYCPNRKTKLLTFVPLYLHHHR